MRLVLKKIIIALLLVFPLYGPSNSFASTTPTVMLFIDTSGSMRGEKIEQVKQALQTVIVNLNQDIPVAIYSFSDSVVEIEPATRDRTLLLSRLAGLEAKGKTRLHDALSVALEIAENSRPYKVIFLSDGKDSASKISYDEIVLLMQTRNAQFDLVGLQLDKKTTLELSNLATSSNGKFYQVENIEMLSMIYKNIIDQSQTIDSKEATSVSVKLKSNENFEIVVSVLAGLICLLLSLAVLARINNFYSIKKNQELISSYISSRKRINLGKARETIVSSLLIPQKVERKIREELEKIHSEKNYRSVVSFGWIFLGLSAFFGFVMTEQILISILLALFATYQLFNFGVKRVLKKQRENFDDELPEMLNVVTSGLTAGLGLQQSLEAYISDSEGEVSIQLNRALGEVRVGTPIDEALMRVSQRMENDSLKMVVTALSIQRVVGGSLATVIRSSYDTIRSRNEIRREVMTLSAEGRLSANVLIGLPIFIFFFLFITRPEYVSIFWSTSLGFVLLGVFFVNMLFGILWMKKIVNIRI